MTETVIIRNKILSVQIRTSTKDVVLKLIADQYEKKSRLIVICDGKVAETTVDILVRAVKGAERNLFRGNSGALTKVNTTGPTKLGIGQYSPDPDTRLHVEFYESDGAHPYGISKKVLLLAISKIMANKFQGEKKTSHYRRAT